MKLFIASTPYNLFNYINMKINLFKNENVDLIISNFDKKNENYYNNLKRLNIFNNVYFVEQSKFNENDLIKNPLKRNIKKTIAEIINRFFFDYYFSIYCSKMDKKRKYDEIYVDAFGFMPRFIFNHYYKNNKQVKIFKVDCGVESYFDARENNQITRKQKYITGKIQKRLSGYYLYSSELANVGNYPVFLLPKINTCDKSFVNIINSVFEYTDYLVKHPNNGIIFFDQVLSDDINLDNKEEEIIQCLQRILGNDYSVKLHPRTSIDSVRYKNIETIKTNSTMEILLLNNFFNNEDVFITPFSTAVALPKLLFDKEPTIIILTKLFEEMYIEGVLTTQYFSKIANTYSDKGKVIIPASLKEFEKILMELKSC